MYCPDSTHKQVCTSAFGSPRVLSFQCHTHISGNLLVITFCDCTAAKIISPSPVLAIWPSAAEDDLLRGECELLGLWVLAHKHISQREGRKSHNAEVRNGCYTENDRVMTDWKMQSKLQ